MALYSYINYSFPVFIYKLRLNLRFTPIFQICLRIKFFILKFYIHLLAKSPDTSVVGTTLLWRVELLYCMDRGEGAALGQPIVAESAEAGDAEKASRIWTTANHCVRERPRMTAPELILLYHRCKSRCEENLPPSMNIYS